MVIIFFFIVILLGIFIVFLSTRDEKKPKQQQEEIVEQVSSFVCSKSNQVYKQSVRTDVRILDGKVVREDKYPFIGMILYNGEYICACSLIGNRFALSAAHCILENANYELKFAQVDIRYPSPKAISSLVKRVIVHPKYNSNTLDFDICLFELSTPIFDIIPICVGKTVPNYVTIAGWGVTEENKTSLMLLETTTLSKSENCEFDIDPKTHFCATSAVTCYGDSGGPVFYEHPTFGYIQIGIVSYGSRICKDKPGVFTRLSYHFDWILQQMTAI